MTAPSERAGDWQTCTIGSCHRHQRCMYRPCRNRGAPIERTKDMSDLKPMDVAPTDGYILAKTLPRPDDERFSHYGDRWFAVRHAGRTSQMDLDMGWHLFPGMGVSADWFAGWMHIPEKDRIATLEAQLAEAREENLSLRGALKLANNAIAEYYRYWTGGETRGSYDGKPERNGLWSVQRIIVATLSKIGGNHDG